MVQTSSQGKTLQETYLRLLLIFVVKDLSHFDKELFVGDLGMGGWDTVRGIFDKLLKGDSLRTEMSAFKKYNQRMRFALYNTTTHKAHGTSGFASFNRVSTRLLILTTTEENLERCQCSITYSPRFSDTHHVRMAGPGSFRVLMCLVVLVTGNFDQVLGRSQEPSHVTRFVALNCRLESFARICETIGLLDFTLGAVLWVL